ncbi:serine--tRNA ligase, mitochondrial-like [Lineus longissimus]|uniref:serine--tRNA ligase, mitochondrial-like n=1 Tax=Lineus longissimus TaxID=88925 RepID=UPI00315D7E84
MKQMKSSLLCVGFRRIVSYGTPSQANVLSCLSKAKPKAKVSTTRAFSSSTASEMKTKPLLNRPEYDWLFLCNPAFTEELEQNIVYRKGVGDIRKVLELYKKLESTTKDADADTIKEELLDAASHLPNISHPSSPVGEESCAEVVDTFGTKRDFSFQPKGVVELGAYLGILRTKDLGLTTGQRTYYFIGALAKLEQALIQYSLDKLVNSGFTLVSVPDLIAPEIIEACGFNTTGTRTQVYKLGTRHGDMCLAGTAEMSLAGMFMNKVLQDTELPKKVAAVSRCYRAETSSVEEESGIYRVHHFTKVEMFGVTANESGEESEALFNEFVDIQKELFAGLGLNFQILNMPTQELGAPAYKKYDIEAWMPHKKFYGEISSTSNCTDYQSRRLHMKYVDDRYAVHHVHTVNGTACAIPRMVMAVLENYQNKDGSITVPERLVEYMGMDRIVKDCEPPIMQWIKKVKKT